VVPHEKVHHEGVGNHDGVIINASGIENHHDHPEEVNEFIGHKSRAFLSNKGMKNHLVKVHHGG
jgi:hypothetical protein